MYAALPSIAEIGLRLMLLLSRLLSAGRGLSISALILATTTGHLGRADGPRFWSCSDPSPNPIAAEPDARRVLSRVGVADHEVTLKAPWAGSGWREYSYSGFGGGHPSFHPHVVWRTQSHQLTCQLGSL
jgi:hypothetical protein